MAARALEAACLGHLLEHHPVTFGVVFGMLLGLERAEDASRH